MDDTMPCNPSAPPCTDAHKRTHYPADSAGSRAPSPTDTRRGPRVATFFLSAPAEPSRSYTERGQTELILFTYLLTNIPVDYIRTHIYTQLSIGREAYRPAPPRSSRMRQRGGQGIKNDGNMTVVCEGERGTCTTVEGYSRYNGPSETEDRGVAHRDKKPG